MLMVREARELQGNGSRAAHSFFPWRETCSIRHFHFVGTLPASSGLVLDCRRHAWPQRRMQDLFTLPDAWVELA